MMTRVTPQKLLTQSNWFGARPKEVTATEKIEDEVKT
jgi:hypothetical protein